MVGGSESACVARRSSRVRTRWIRSACFVFSWAFAITGCGGIAKQESTPPPASDAAVTPIADSGTDAAAPSDGSDAAAADAAQTERCVSGTQVCCDPATGERSTPRCDNGTNVCEGNLSLQATGAECEPVDAVCRVESVEELLGRACRRGTLSCRIGLGCASCVCNCSDSSQTWQCACIMC